MKRTFTSFALALLISAGAQAATIATTLTVTATTAVGSTGITANGTATLTNIGSGPIVGTLPLTSLAGATATATFTITLSGGTLTGTLSVPTALLINGTAGSGSATITGGTGTYAGATGSFPSLPGSATGSLASGFTLSFSGAGSITTTGGGPTTPVPAITDVLDAGSYTANIAQGSIFVVKGSTLSASGFTQLSFPLPTSSAGVKITFTPTAGGAGTDAFLIYLYNLSGVNQLAAILPSTLAVGNYNVTVTNGGTASAAFPVTVVQRKIGLITQDGTGTGLSVIQNYISASQLDIDRLTTGTVGGFTISPAKPGQVLIAWATGMGPVTGGDNTASPGFNFVTSGVAVRVLVGGVSITPDYAGRAPGLAGADQINFTLPANVPTGCSVTFQVSVSGVLSNPTTIAIAPAGASACVQPGYTTQQLQNLDQGGSITTGAFYLSQLSLTVPSLNTVVKSNSAAGSIIKITGFQLASAPTQSQISTSGDCQVIHTVSTGSAAAGGGVAVGLDAGTVTLNGPAASNITNLAFTQDPKYNTYFLKLATEGISIPGQSNGTITAGTYTLAAAGGKDVRSFNSSLTLGTPISVTGGLPATVNRNAGLTLNWTGGNSNDIVQIVGGASLVTGTGVNAITDSTTFICTTTAGPGTFTVPASILVQVPAVAANLTNGGGYLQVSSTAIPSTFSAGLVAGGSVDGFFLGFVGTANTPAYQ